MSGSSSAILQQKFYTVTEVAELFRQKPDWVRRHFGPVDGVLHLGRKRLGKRRYDPILVPESVLQRWVADHSVSAPVHAEMSLLRKENK